MTPAPKNYSRQCREQTMTAKNRRAEVLLKLIAAADSQQPLARGVLNAILSPSRVLRNQAADRRNLDRHCHAGEYRRKILFDQRPLEERIYEPRPGVHDGLSAQVLR